MMLNLSPLNQTIIQDKQANLDSTNNSLNVSDNQLKKDTFTSSTKKAKISQKIVFGSILGGIGIAIGAAFFVYKGKLGSKAQSFVENFVKKSNRQSGNVIATTPESVPIVSKKASTVLIDPIDIPDKINVPQNSVQKVAQGGTKEPVIPTPTHDVLPSKTTIKPTVNSKNIPPVNTSEKPIKIQAKSPVVPTVEAPTINKTVHDISKGAESHKLKLKFPDSDEEIELILPKNPNPENNGSIYSKLKHPWGEDYKNRVIRGFQIGNNDKDMIEFEQYTSKIIDDILDEKVIEDLFADHDVLMLMDYARTKSNLSNSAKEFLGEIITGQTDISKCDGKVKNELVAFLKTLKTDISGKYKEALLGKVDDIYSFMEKEISPLKNTHHCYRGVAPGAVVNGDVNAGDLYIKHLSDLKIGDTVTPDYGAMFVTASAEYATNYTKKDGVLFHIILPAGAKMDSPNSMESLLPPMAKYKVVGNKQVGKDGFRVIDLEYLIDQGTRKL